jgi:phage shock protein PspC (stress-responsive transcriptional regulator)
MDTTTTHQPAANATGADHQPGLGTGPQPLYRPAHDRMLAGVASGIARYFGIDVTVVRIILAVLAVVGGAAVPLYLAGWLLIPDEGADQSIASSFLASVQSRSR